MSTISVKTNAWDEVALIRHARPYKLAVIELVFAVSGNAPSFRVVFSEFGNNICTGTSKSSVNIGGGGAGGGVTYIRIAPGAFSNIANVTSSSTMSYNLTTDAGVYTDMFISSVFDSTALNEIRMVTSKTTGTNFEFVGKVMLVIKEYYG